MLVVFLASLVNSLNQPLVPSVEIFSIVFFQDCEDLHQGEESIPWVLAVYFLIEPSFETHVACTTGDFVFRFDNLLSLKEQEKLLFFVEHRAQH